MHLWQVRVKFATDIVGEEGGEDETPRQESLKTEPAITPQRCQEHGDRER